MSMPKAMLTSAGAPASSAGTIFKANVLLVLVGLVAYGNSFTKPFYLDDRWITGTEKIKDLGEYLALMPNRPVFAFSLYANYRLHELDVFGYHLFNVAVHLAAALILFALVRETLLLPRWQGRYAGSSVWLALAVALLWMVHPLQTQAVTYMIQRSESMMGCFFFLTIYCVLRGTQTSHPWPWYGAAWFSCALGAGCKEVMIAIVPILLAYERIFVADWKAIWRQRRFFYGALAAIWVAPLVRILPIMFEAQPENTAGFDIPQLPAHVYWMTQAWVLLYYLCLCFIPDPLCFRYVGWPLTTEFSAFLPAGLVIGLLVVLTIWLLVRYPALGFLGLWYFAILSITSFIPLADIAFEHRLYLPLAAICSLVVIGGYDALKIMVQQYRSSEAVIPAKTRTAATMSSLSGKVAPALATLFLLAVALGLIFLTLKRNEDYRRTSSLWASVDKLYPENLDILNMIAYDYEEHEEIGRALDSYQKILRIMPTDTAAQFHYGMLLCRQDQVEEGVKRQEYCMASAVDEVKESSVFSREIGQAHHAMGKSYWILGQSKKAEERFRKALLWTPSKADYHSALALVLQDQQRTDEAHACYQRALALNSAWPKKARSLAAKFLYRYPLTSRWTRKEALFYAKQAAQATEFENLGFIDMLVEAYAGCEMVPQAEQLSQQATRTVASNNKEWQEQIARTIAYYQQHELPSRNRDVAPKK